MGLIASMHYIGMAAMWVEATPVYDPRLVVPLMRSRSVYP